MNLTEAFRALDALNEDTFSVSDDGIAKLAEFQDNDDLVDEIKVMDPEATTEDELADSYVGKVILDCCVCHSKLYKDATEVTLNEEGTLANVEEECPYCYSADGFKVVGQVAAYGGEEAPADDEGTVADDAADNDDGKMDEGLFDKLQKKPSSRNVVRPAQLKKGDLISAPGTPEDKQKVFKVHPEKGGFVQVDFNSGKSKKYKDSAKIVLIPKKNESLKESVNKPNFDVIEGISGQELEDILYRCILYVNDYLVARRDTCSAEEAVWEAYDEYFPDEMEELGISESAYDEDTIIMLLEWVIENQFDWESYDDIDESLKESVNNVNVETDDSIVNVNTDENGKVTVTTEPNAAPAEEGDEMIVPVDPDTQSEIESGAADDEFVDMDVNEFDEESFDELGESYLKETYDNVVSYKTTDVSTDDKSIFVEGVITFDSGAKKKTSFVFEAKDATRSGKVRLIGENVQITAGKKSFTVSGHVKDNKFITESFNYNYRAKDDSGNSSRVYGTVRK